MVISARYYPTTGVGKKKNPFFLLHLCLELHLEGIHGDKNNFILLFFFMLGLKKSVSSSILALSCTVSYLRTFIDFYFVLSCLQTDEKKKKSTSIDSC